MKTIIEKSPFFHIALIDDVTGKPIEVWWDFPQVSIRSTFNKGGLITVVAPEDHPIVQYEVPDTLFSLSLLSRIPSEDFSSGRYASKIMSYGLYRDRQILSDENGRIYHMLYLFHPLEVLDRYVSGYPTGVDGKSQWTGARMSVIANDLVRWNCTEDATVANGRIRDADRVRNFHDMGAVSGTPIIDFKVEPGTPIMDIIRELSRLGPFNFSVGVSDLISPAGLITVQSELTSGSLGNDVSDHIFFSLDLENIRRINLNTGGLEEKTVAIVGGQGEGLSREFEVVEGVNYSNPNNGKELWVNASTSPSGALEALGNSQLARVAAKNRFSADIASSYGWVPFLDYNIGDLVTVVLGNTSDVQRITSIDMSWDQSQRPTISVEFESFTFS